MDLTYHLWFEFDKHNYIFVNEKESIQEQYWYQHQDYKQLEQYKGLVFKIGFNGCCLSMAVITGIATDCVIVEPLISYVTVDSVIVEPTGESESFRLLFDPQKGLYLGYRMNSEYEEYRSIDGHTLVRIPYVPNND